MQPYTTPGVPQKRVLHFLSRDHRNSQGDTLPRESTAHLATSATVNTDADMPHGKVHCKVQKTRGSALALLDHWTPHFAADFP